LFLTGYKNEEHLFRGYDLGAVDFLFKPIVPEILQSKVSVFVELSRNAALLQEQTEELQRAEKRLRGVLEAAPEAMIMSGRQDRIQRVNSETEGLFGRPRIDLIGQPVSILTPDWPLAPGTQEVTAVTLEGNMFPAEVSLKPLATDEGGIVISVFRDIT